MQSAKCLFCRALFIQKYKEQKFCSISCSNRYNLNNKIFVKVPQEPNIQLAELFGILLGDGSVTKYFVKVYSNRVTEREYAAFVFDLSHKLFPEAPISVFERVRYGTLGTQISSKDVCDYLGGIGFDGKIRSIPNWINDNVEFTKAAIRGLFDTEGSVGIKFFRGVTGNCFYKQLTFTNKNRNILDFVEKGLNTMGYNPTKRSNKNIYISNSEDIERYIVEIGSHNPKLTNKLKIQKIDEFIQGGLRRMVRHRS